MLFLYIQKPVEKDFLTPVLPCDFGNDLKSKITTTTETVVRNY